jgi:hypothetical protein
MINNYINNLIINDYNDRLVINFKNNVCNCDSGNLTKNNFRLHLLSKDIYNNIEIDNVYLNDKNSYTLLFKIKKNYIEHNSAILIELLSIYTPNLDKLNNHQQNNYIYLNNKDIKLEKKYKNMTPSIKQNTLYLNKSSPLLAYNQNLKNYHINQINNYSKYYGDQINKYPSSYYSTSYTKFFKPSN